MRKRFRKGERVEWRSHGGSAVGRIVERVTGRRTVQGHVAKATPDDPQYLVETDDGKRAIHRPEALRKR